MNCRQRTLRVVLVTMALIHSIGCIETAFVGRVARYRVSRTAGSFWQSVTSHDDGGGGMQPMSLSAEYLLENALGRAMLTMSTKSIVTAEMNTPTALESVLQDVAAATVEASAVESEPPAQTQYFPRSLQLSTDIMLQGAIGRAMRTLSTKAPQEEQANIVTDESQKRMPEFDNVQFVPTVQMDGYLANPAITPTALAHQMWAHALRPNVDTVIDATCGNGNDSVAIASILFSDDDSESASTTDIEPQLICIDILEEACETTRGRLAQLLHADTMTCHVNVLCTSHSPLPLPRDQASVGLVCYNLGYLPQSDRAMLTQMETTISSIADAALMIRVGGMISVTTYPRSNKNEDYAVHALLEGLALLSSKSVDWRRDYVDELGPDPESRSGEDEYVVQETVRAALERIVAEGPRKQTWRVLENKMLGRALSPILLTATRIK